MRGLPALLLGAALALPAAAQAPAPAKNAGTAKTSGTVLSVDRAAGTLKLKDKAGLAAEFLIGPETKVVRERKPAQLSDIAPGDRVRLLRYERRTRLILRIELARR